MNRYLDTENVPIVASFSEGDTVTVTVIDLATSTKIVDAVAMTFINLTGFKDNFIYNFNPVISGYKNYEWIADNGIIVPQKGKFTRGGYPDTIVDKLPTNFIMGSDDQLPHNHGIVVTPMMPNSIDLADTVTIRVGLKLNDIYGGTPTSGQITAGSLAISRKAKGDTLFEVIYNAGISKTGGQVYLAEVFDSLSDYEPGDTLRFVFYNQKVTINGIDHVITTSGSQLWFQTHIRETIVPTITDTNTKVTAIEIDVAGLDGEAMRGTDGANTVVPASRSEATSDKDEILTSIVAIDTKMDAQTVILAIIKGLSLGNYRQDETTFITEQGQSLLTGSRIRVFANATDTENDENELIILTTTLTYDGLNEKSIKVVEVEES